MTLFNKNLIKLIIDKYFNKTYISHYIYYNEQLYEKLALILNEMINFSYYHNHCLLFNQNLELINFNMLLEDNKNLFEYQSFILLIYELLLKLQILDCFNFIIDLIKMLFHFN